jgi:hypothetical protein
VQEWLSSFFSYNGELAVAAVINFPGAFCIYKWGVASLEWLRTRTWTSAAQAPYDEESRHMIERDDSRSD